MVKEEEIMAEAGGRGYMDMLGLGDEAMADYFLCPSPSSSSYLSSAAVSTTTTTSASYLPPPQAAPYRHILSFGGRPEQEQQYPGVDIFGALQCYYSAAGGGGEVGPVAVPQKSSPTTECSSSISSMSSSPTATAASTPKPQPAPKKRGSRSSEQRKAAAAAAGNKRPRVRRERLGERILALQQLVSPFGKTDTASVLHEALGYIRFLHDQVQVLSSPYMQQRLPPSSAPRADTEPRAGAPADLRSRGLCLVPVSCTDHVAGGGNGNGADVWSSVAAMGLAADLKEEEEEEAAVRRGDRHPGQMA
uniref:Uncharacterized protein n=1 Tax=Avena sativa TaxID=4498 RepID=A0ACD5X7U6_AVESA